MKEREETRRGMIEAAKKFLDGCPIPVNYAMAMVDFALEYEPPDDPEFNALLGCVVDDINEKYRAEGRREALGRVVVALENLMECDFIDNSPSAMRSRVQTCIDKFTVEAQEQTND